MLSVFWSSETGIALLGRQDGNIFPCRLVQFGRLLDLGRMLRRGSFLFFWCLS